jgi:hypothetical protein
MERMVYAFRVFGDTDEPWYGDENALKIGEYETDIYAFEPGHNPSRFKGKTLEFRHGLMPDDGQPAPMRGYTNATVDGKPVRVRVRADVQAILFSA